MKIADLLHSHSIVDELDEDELKKIGEDVVTAYEADLHSRQAWEDQNDEWMKLALQIREEKTYPWPKAANIKYPLLTTAALQFVSRAYPSLVPSFDIVKAKPIGTDPTGGQMQEIAEKIGTHMSYQILYEMDDWEDSMDKLCLVLPIVGCAFKKTYFSPYKGKNCSELILPKDLVVNYWAKNLESTSRKTHRFYWTPNDILERQRMGILKEYDDFKFGPGKNEDVDKKAQDASKLTTPVSDQETPRLILEQHGFLDLDEDDYREPYCITVDYETRKVLRITPRFRDTGVMFHPKHPDRVAKIKPIEYFTKFSFIPNPDGGFYDLGFGLLLGSLNESANTMLNQLTDAGTLSTLQSGFLAKGLRIGKSGSLKFEPGEWKWVNNTFEDLKKGIFPMPVREPSPVLFQLLGMLVQSGKELASIAEIFTGKMPGQNTPAATTMATIEQGLKVFTSIYKRIYRSLGKEFEKLFELNGIYLEDGDVQFSYEQDGFVTDSSINKGLYQQAKVKIVPAADPNMVTETQKLMQVQAMMELAQYGRINPDVLTRRSLEAHAVSGIAELMQMPPPPPPMEIQLLQMELADKDKDRQIEAFKVQSEHMKRQSEIQLNLAKAKQAGNELEVLQLELELKKEEAQMDAHMKIMDMLFKREEHQMDMQHEQEKQQLDMKVARAGATMDLAHKGMAHQQNLKMMKEKAAAKPKPVAK